MCRSRESAMHVVWCAASWCIALAMGTASIPSTNAATTIVRQASVNGLSYDPGNGLPIEYLTDPLSIGVSTTRQRSSVEFNLSSLPVNAIIESAAFVGYLNLKAPSVGVITVDFGVYPGNGVAELADVFATSTSSGQYSISSFPPDLNVSIPIDAHAVQSARLTSSYVGLNMWRNPSSQANALAFVSLDNPNPYPRPALAVTYSIPEPSLSGLMVSCTLILLRRKAFVRAWKAGN